jgi:hypothetical protein
MIAFQDRQGMPIGPAIRSKRRVIRRQPHGARRQGRFFAIAANEILCRATVSRNARQADTACTRDSPRPAPRRGILQKRRFCGAGGQGRTEGNISPWSGRKSRTAHRRLDRGFAPPSRELRQLHIGASWRLDSTLPQRPHPDSCG